jgi:hypothetical protein
MSLTTLFGVWFVLLAGFVAGMAWSGLGAHRGTGKEADHED